MTARAARSATSPLASSRGYSRGEPFGRTWTNSKPKRPFTHRLPWVTSESDGESTFTIVLSWTWSGRVQPTPQYGQIVSATVCTDSSYVPSARISYSAGTSARRSGRR